MKLQPGFRRWLKELIQPSSSPALENALEQHKDTVPVLWLLGKTGAGKSSIIQRLTGDSKTEIGNGFAPCTKTAQLYNHPASAPVVRFLDTRGLGEAKYDATEDIELASHASHALILVTRVDDTAQSAVLEALAAQQKKLTSMAILHVHTHLHTLSEEELNRAIQFNSEAVANALGRKPESVLVDFTSAEDGFEDINIGLSELRRAIVSLVPELTRVLTLHEADNRETEVFLPLRREILGYASATAAVDLFPAVGLFAVPTVQGKLLHTLAGRYNIEWNRQVALEFVAALGSGFLYRYAISLAGRQLGKFIPVYGQSAGAAAAATLSFASTYALGRAACMYFYHQQNQLSISTESLQEAFKQALKDQKAL
ncbi:MAG: YcjF family protein [Granulosicoccus sp.]